MDVVKVAKIVESLSTCPRLQDLMFLAFIKKHEKNKTVCSKYFYDICLHMHKNDNVYKLDHADINFLENSIIPNYMIDDILLNFNQSAGLTQTYQALHFSFLALIVMYSNSAYKYLFVPIITDYSVDSSLVHQCGLVVDLHNGLFLFYEPYGVYQKYDATYVSGMAEFLQQYQFPDKFYSNGQLNLDTWHNYFGLSTGIQTILLHAHNAISQEFENDKIKYMDELKVMSPTHYTQIADRLERGKNRPVHKDDLTFDTMEIAGYFGNHLPLNDVVEINALQLYYKYNSKTCVTITITELDYFFENLANLPKSEQATRLAVYYDEFAKLKNQKLFMRLDEFISNGLNSEVVNSLAENSLANICSMLDK